MYSEKLENLRQPKQLVENRVSFAGPDSEVSIYDTYQSINRVGLDADQLLYCGMVKGKKIMHSQYCDDQIFLPHESFVMAPGTSVEIDFPDADLHDPTTCLTVEITKEKIESVAQGLNKTSPLHSKDREWGYSEQVLHTQHSTATQRLISRLVSIFAENHTDRNMLIDLNITELVVRMMRKQECDFLLAYCTEAPDESSLTVAVEFIKNNLSQNIDTDDLCKKACMGRSRLYREFKERLGCSPSELQQQLRLQEAASRFQRGEVITAVCYDIGFSSPSHFCRRFKGAYGCTPTEYRNRFVNDAVVYAY